LRLCEGWGQVNWGWIIIRIECGGLSLEACLLCVLAAC